MVLPLANTLACVGAMASIASVIFSLAGTGQGMMFAIGWRVCSYIAVTANLETVCNAHDSEQRVVLYITFAACPILPLQIYNLWMNIHWTLAAT